MNETSFISLMKKKLPKFNFLFTKDELSFTRDLLVLVVTRDKHFSKYALGKDELTCENLARLTEIITEDWKKL